MLSHGNAQGIRNLTVDESTNGQRLASFLLDLEQQHGMDFIYKQGVINALTINGVTETMYLSDFLEIFLEPFNLKVVKVKEDVLFIIKEDLRWEFGRKQSNYIVFQSSNSEAEFVKGTIIDRDSGEPVVGAQVTIPKTDIGELTNASGYFEIKVPKDIYQLNVRFIGYETVSYIIGFSERSKLEEVDFTLFPLPVELAGVTITAEGRDKNVQAIVPGVEKMGIEEIKKLPTFLGEIDPIKILTTLPGVSTVGELSSGFNVRGGESGQNLILQDGAIIYNPTHLFGFFSAFNPDVVQDIVLYKGGGPARFGGRISSVLDIKLGNGDASNHKITGGVGMVSSRLAIEGPIIKNRSSYFIGGRIAYPNWLLKTTDNIQLVNSSARFYDLTGKIFHKINDNNFLSFTGYHSYDDFRLASDSTYSWQTNNFSLRWDHNFSKRLLSTFSFTNSNYNTEIYNKNEIDKFSYVNSIKNFWLKWDFIYEREDGVVYNFGIDANKTILEPGRLDPIGDHSNTIAEDMEDQNVVELAAYIQGDFDLNERWAISAGLRYSHFFRLGEELIYNFDYNNQEGRYPDIDDSIRYKPGEIIADFGGLAPRVSLRFLADESTSLKASYYRTYQFLHFISNTTSVTPQNYWISSGPYLDPGIGDQVTLGLFKNLRNDLYEVSIEGYYKKISNAVDYIEGADITLNKALEAGLIGGKGIAYGMEFLAKKNDGKLNGWISYTYSRSLRKFQSDKQVENINNGNYYPSAYDQPHNLSVILNYRLSPRTVLSTNFSYSTGRPITIPISKFSYDAYLSVLNYSERNEYRIPDYHRLDLSLTIQGGQRKNSSFRGEWVFSVFNVYSRNNTYSIFFNQYGRAKKVSILGSIFPSLSYNFKF